MFFNVCVDAGNNDISKRGCAASTKGQRWIHLTTTATKDERSCQKRTKATPTPSSRLGPHSSRPDEELLLLHDPPSLSRSFANVDVTLVVCSCRSQRSLLRRLPEPPPSSPQSLSFCNSPASAQARPPSLPASASQVKALKRLLLSR